MNKEELYKKAINKWGEDFQLKMVAEECAELIKAVLKFNRKSNSSTLEQIADEIADTEIMLGQLKIILHEYFSEINELITQKKIGKLKRLKHRLSKHHGQPCRFCKGHGCSFCNGRGII